MMSCIITRCGEIPASRVRRTRYRACGAWPVGSNANHRRHHWRMLPVENETPHFGRRNVSAPAFRGKYPPIAIERCRMNTMHWNWPPIEESPFSERPFFQSTKHDTHGPGRHTYRWRYVQNGWKARAFDTTVTAPKDARVAQREKERPLSSFPTSSANTYIYIRNLQYPDGVERPMIRRDILL